MARIARYLRGLLDHANPGATTALVEGFEAPFGLDFSRLYIGDEL